MDDLINNKTKKIPPFISLVILYHNFVNISTFRRFESVYRPEENEIVRCTMKSERGSDEIFGVPPQMKSKPCGFG